MSDIALTAAKADLESGRCASGIIRRQWEIVSFDFPRLVITVAATELDQSASRYAFRYELSDFPTQAPSAQIWDVQGNCVLPLAKRPQGNARVQKAFQQWQSDTVYRAWERLALAHGQWRVEFPKAAWQPTMSLIYTFEDLYALLNGNALRAPVLSAA